VSAHALSVGKPSLKPDRDARRKRLVPMLKRAEGRLEVLAALEGIDARRDEFAREQRGAGILSNTSKPDSGGRIELVASDELAADER